MRNTAVRVFSLAVSFSILVAVTYISENPDAVSVSIMLTTLFFTVLRSGFTFTVLSNQPSKSSPALSLTIDKCILVGLIFLYSRYLGIPTGPTIYTLFAASVITFIFRKQYLGYTKGQITSSLLISFIFPIQVTINILFAYWQPQLIFTLPFVLAMLYLSYDRFLTATDKFGLVEVYYSLLLPLGGLSAISIEGIDKPLYLIVSKVIDSVSSVASFAVQGNVKQVRMLAGKHNIGLLLTPAAVLVFTTGYLLHLFTQGNIYAVLYASMLVNVCWFTYSMFTIIFLIKHGAHASQIIYSHIMCFGIITSGLFILGYFEPIHIVIALSASFVFSMLSAKFNVRAFFAALYP